MSYSVIGSSLWRSRRKVYNKLESFDDFAEFDFCDPSQDRDHCDIVFLSRKAIGLMPGVMGAKVIPRRNATAGKKGKFLFTNANSGEVDLEEDLIENSARREFIITSDQTRSAAVFYGLRFERIFSWGSPTNKRSNSFKHAGLINEKTRS